MICLYDSKCTDFTNNGLVVLSDCQSFLTTESNNGSFEVEFEYPLDERGKWQYISEGNIVKNNDGQLFRIYSKKKTLSGIRANARHIFYDLLDNFLEDVRPTVLSGEAALDWVLTHTQYPHPFTSMGDVGGVGTKYFVKKNPVEAIMGQDGIIANWGGELERDNFTIKLLKARGLDRGVLVSYGKNIIGIEETMDLDGVVTRLYPTGKDGLTIPEKYVDSPFINNYAHPKIKEVTFSDIDNAADLRTAAQNYFSATSCDLPSTNYTVDFLELTKTEEYKNYSILESIYMGDTVTVRHLKLNMDLKCKVIAIKKNDLTGRIEKVELGNFKPNLANSMSRAISAINSISDGNGGLNGSVLASAIANATNLIINGNDGHVVNDQNGISIMDTTDKNTAKEVWRWNLNGLGFSSTGWDGPFDIAITADGKIVADFITTGKLLATLIYGGTLTLGGSDNQNGTLKFLDSIGNLLAQWDNLGLLLKGQAIDSISTDFKLNSSGLDYRFSNPREDAGGLLQQLLLTIQSNYNDTGVGGASGGYDDKGATICSITNPDGSINIDARAGVFIPKMVSTNFNKALALQNRGVITARDGNSLIALGDTIVLNFDPSGQGVINFPADSFPTTCITAVVCNGDSSAQPNTKIDVVHWDISKIVFQGRITTTGGLPTGQVRVNWFAIGY